MSEEEVRACIRLTARIAVGLFCVVFSASSVVALRPSRATKWLLRNRRSLGLALAATMAVHGGFIIALARGWPEHFQVAPTTAAGGGLGYAFLLAMTLTSTDAAQARLGRRRWKLLHTAGMYWLFVVFAATYGGAAAADPIYLAAAIPLLAALGLRIAARIRASLRAASGRGSRARAR